MIQRVVLDACAAANIVMRTDLAGNLIEQLEQSVLVMAPGLFHAEISNTLWKYVRNGDLDTHAAISRYEEAIALVDLFEDDRNLATEAIASASQFNHPVYDLLYAVLARRYACAVLTVDKRLRLLLTQMSIRVL